MWKEFLEHPCWRKIEKALKARMEGLQHDLEQAAWQGDAIKAARIAGALELLRWVMRLPTYIDEQEKSRYNTRSSETLGVEWSRRKSS